MGQFPPLLGRRFGRRAPAGLLIRVRGETGASMLVLSVAITSTVVVLLTFAVTTLVDEPATAAALGVIVLLSVALDVGWKRIREGRIPAR